MFGMSLSQVCYLVVAVLAGLALTVVFAMFKPRDRMDRVSILVAGFIGALPIWMFLPALNTQRWVWILAIILGLAYLMSLQLLASIIWKK